MNLEIGGDASGALGALAATQAAIDALHGKSVEVDVAVNGAGGATDGLGRIKEGSERAGEAHDKHTASLGRNEEALGRHEDALGRASEGAREHADATERASEGVREHAEETERANDSLGRNAEAHDRAAQSVQQHASQEERAVSSIQKQTEQNDALANALARVEASRQARASGQPTPSLAPAAAPAVPSTPSLRSAPSDVERAEALKSATQRLSEAQTQAAASSVAWRKAYDEAYSTAPAGADAAKLAEKATADLRKEMDASSKSFRDAQSDVTAMQKAFGVTPASTRAAATAAKADTASTSSLQREDLPSPTGIQRAEAMESATKRLESAQTQAAATAVQYRKAFDEAFEDAPAGVNATEHARQATADLRGEMTTARNDFRQAATDVSSMEKAFGDTAEMGEVFEKAAEGVGGSLQTVGMGAAIATAGIGLVGTATAALGAGAAFESIEKTPGLAYQAALAMRDFDKAFQHANQTSLQAGMPGMKDLQQSLGGLGAVAASIGADQLPNVLKDANTLVHDFGHMAMALEPAMKPAEDAATSFFGSLMAGVGASAPAIAAFSNTLAASGPQIQQFTTGTINAMSGIGRLTVDAADMATPAVSGAGNIIDKSAGFVDDHRDAIGSAASTASKVLPYLNFLPGVGMLSGAASVNNMLSAAAPSGAGSGYSDADWSRGQQMGATWAHSSPKYGTMQGDPAPLGADPASQQQLTAPPKPLQAPSRATGQAAGTPDVGSLLTPAQAEKQLQEGPRHTPGSSASLPSPEQTQQLTSGLQQVKTASDSAQQSISQIGQTATPSLQQAAQSAQTLPQHMQQSLSQLPQQAEQSLAPLQPALQQAMQPPPPPDMAQPVQQATQHAVAQVQQAAPQMQSASQDLGSSIPTGTAAGITKDEDVPVTIIRHLIEKIITEGSDALDSHSPSRVFESLGATIPQGVAVGIQSQASVAVSATQQLMGQVVGVGQAQAAAAQGQLANNGLIGQNGMLSGLTNGINPSALNNNLAALNNYGTGLNQFAGQYGSAYDQLSRRDQDRDKDKDQDKDGPKSLQDIQDEQTKVGRDDPEFKNRGFSDATLRRLEEQKAQHNQRAQQLQEQRAVLHDSAADQARFGRMPEQQLAQLNAQRAAQGEAPLSQQQAQANQWAQSGVGPSWIDQVKQDRDAKGQQLGDLAGLGHPSPSQQAASLQSQVAQVDQQQKMQSSPIEQLKHVLGMDADSTKQAANKIGQGIPESTADGIRGSQSKSVGAAGDAADAAINETKKKHGVSSPATVWAGIGANLMAGVAQGVSNGGGAVSDALGAVSSGIQATASNNGLQVGYAYAENIETGMQTVVKSSTFQSSAIPQLASAQATTALGQLGDLGPAGGAGQIPKNLQVALSAGVPAQTSQPIQTTVTNIVTLDGQPFRTMIQTEIDNAFEKFANAWQQN